jgi:hypothetical protein
MSAKRLLGIKIPHRILITDSMITGIFDSSVKGIRW